MHELPVTESILKIALSRAERAGAARITDLHLVIGRLASIVDDSVQFYWEIISRGTIAEGATLHFRRIPVELVCSQCRNRFAPPGDDFACPQCGSSHVQVVAGEDFMLEAIEVEEGDGAAPPESSRPREGANT